MQQGQITKKWAKFTYMRKLTKFITKLFTNTSLKIYFKTENTKSLNMNKNINTNKFNKCDIHHSTSSHCNMKYIGQTGSPFHAHDKLKCTYLNQIIKCGQVYCHIMINWTENNINHLCNFCMPYCIIKCKKTYNNCHSTSMISHKHPTCSSSMSALSKVHTETICGLDTTKLKMGRKKKPYILKIARCLCCNKLIGKSNIKLIGNQW
jgi:hypothetical protein